MANVAWMLNAVTGAPEYSGRMVRQAMSAALGGATAARPLGARSGVRPGTPTTTVALTDATHYVIHPHAGVLDTETSAIAGPYMYAIPADETGGVTAAHGTWPRKDILWVRIDDPGETDGTTVPAIVTGYTAGDAAASGTEVAPAIPARSMRLATISVPQSGGGAPTIVWDAPYTVAAGGIITCRDNTERGLLTTTATAENPIYVDVAGFLSTCNDGVTWRDITTRQAWSAHTPTFVSFTLGNGTATGRNNRSGRTIDARIDIILGSTSSVAGPPIYIGLPVGAVSAHGGSVGFGNLVGGGSRRSVEAILSGTDYAILMLPDGSYVGAAVPWAWAATHEIHLTLRYESAT